MSSEAAANDDLLPWDAEDQALADPMEPLAERIRRLREEVGSLTRERDAIVGRSNLLAAEVARLREQLDVTRQERERAVTRAAELEREVEQFRQDVSRQDQWMTSRKF